MSINASIGSNEVILFCLDDELDFILGKLKSFRLNLMREFNVDSEITSIQCMTDKRIYVIGFRIELSSIAIYYRESVFLSASVMDKVLSCWFYNVKCVCEKKDKFLIFSGIEHTIKVNDETLTFEVEIGYSGIINVGLNSNSNRFFLKIGEYENCGVINTYNLTIRGTTDKIEKALKDYYLSMAINIDSLYMLANFCRLNIVK